MDLGGQGPLMSLVASCRERMQRTPLWVPQTWNHCTRWAARPGGGRPRHGCPHPGARRSRHARSAPPSPETSSTDVFWAVLDRANDQGRMRPTAQVGAMHEGASIVSHRLLYMFVLHMVWTSVLAGWTSLVLAQVSPSPQRLWQPPDLRAYTRALQRPEESPLAPEKR